MASPDLGMDFRIMTPIPVRTLVFVLVAFTLIAGSSAQSLPRVKTANGVVQGTIAPSGVSVFKGIPFAAPPVGDLRWREPQPVKNWTGVRTADTFAAQCMQRRIFDDMVFRSSGTSEDCLYLNVWRPATGDRLPVLVYLFGGGFLAGDGSEPRYDGESMAKRGIVSLTVNYRLNVFGFFAHPELTKQSPHHASGDQGLLDQVAALKWVQQNIAAFGGDPRRVTIAGESAGSIAVHALMASPLSRGLMAGAIGESGAMINPTLPPVPLAEGEKTGVAIATALNATSLQALRGLPADQVLAVTAKQGTGPYNIATIEGYFLPKLPVEIFAAGEQARVPLLAGWNSGEAAAAGVLGRGTPATPEGYADALKRLYAERSADVFKAYPAKTGEEVQQAATDLASDRFIAYSTWKWTDQQARTGGKPVYRYFFLRPRPAMAQPDPSGRGGGPSRYAAHSVEIEYAMGNLATNKVYAWTPDDERVSEIMQEYFANFVKTGDPNGSGLPRWAPTTTNAPQVIRIDVQPRLEPDTREPRYKLLDDLYTARTAARRLGAVDRPGLQTATVAAVPSSRTP